MLDNFRSGLRPTALLLAAALAAGASAAAAAENPDARDAADLARAERLVESGELAEARRILDRMIRKKRAPARAYLARSTAWFVEGEVGRGRADLDAALELDPTLRQAWLNRAALDMSRGDYPQALAALLQARELDPAAADNGLNLGAVLVLLGRYDDGKAWLDEYLRLHPGSGEALYLVATNYALGGYADAAVDHLDRAIALDERWRLRARTDPNFADLETHAPFRLLLERDGYQPPEGALTARRTFDLAWSTDSGRLLEAVMNTLQMSGRRVQSAAEVTDRWALLWSDYRIKLAPDEAGEIVVELTAPPGLFDTDSWQRETEALFQDVTVQLVRLRR